MWLPGRQVNTRAARRGCETVDSPGPAGGRVIAFRTRVSDASELEKGNPVVPGTNPVSAIAAHAGDGKPNWESHGDRSLSARTDRQSLCDATTDRDRELPLASHGRC